jgi:hypothetical protein
MTSEYRPEKDTESPQQEYCNHTPLLCELRELGNLPEDTQHHSLNWAQPHSLALDTSDGSIPTQLACTGPRAPGLYLPQPWGWSEGTCDSCLRRDPTWMPLSHTSQFSRQGEKTRYNTARIH